MDLKCCKSKEGQIHFDNLAEISIILHSSDEYTGLSLTLVYSSTNMSKLVWMSGLWKPLVHKNMSDFLNNIFHCFDDTSVVKATAIADFKMWPTSEEELHTFGDD